MKLGTPVVIRTAGAGMWRGLFVRQSGQLITVQVTDAPAHSAHVVGQRREVPASWVRPAPLFVVEGVA